MKPYWLSFFDVVQSILGLILAFGMISPAWSADVARPPALPEPLTLEYALSLADEAHPVLKENEAAIRQAEAEQLEAEALNGINTSLQARLRYVEPPGFNLDRTHDDHRLGLFVDKRLYDFGLTDSLRSAADHELQSQRLLYIGARQQRRIDIMQRYFEVVLADMMFYRYNEEMAVVFVALDKLRDRNELGQVSEFEILEKDAEYQRIRHLRFLSQNQQRVSRARLAVALNRPGQLPDTVTPPALPQLQRKLQEVEALQRLASEYNPLILSLRAQSAAAQSRVAAARASDNAVLRGGLEANAYTKERSSYDDWRANLTLDIPLSTGGRTDASLAREQAKLYQLQAKLEQTEISVRQQVLELWLELDALKSKRDEMRSVKEFRELYLDRSRALYELEVKTDLGDAMARVSEAQHDAAKTDFQIALAWSKLDVLTGQMKLNNPMTPVNNTNSR